MKIQFDEKSRKTFFAGLIQELGPEIPLQNLLGFAISLTSFQFGGN